MVSLIISLQLGQRKVRGLASTIFSSVQDRGTSRIIQRVVRQDYLFQFRSSSLKYLVPLPINSSAMPLSVNWYIQTPGETDAAPRSDPPPSPVFAAAVVCPPNSQPLFINLSSASLFSNTKMVLNFFTPIPRPAWISRIFM